MIWRELPPTAGLPLHWSDFTRVPADSLENLLANFLGVSRTWVTNSGTAALVVAFETLKRLAEQRHEIQRVEVIIPGYSCPLVVHAAQKAGLTVVLCDTQPGHFDFEYQLLNTLCTDRTLCVVPTHLGGISADMDQCLSIARSNGAYVVEDAAQALGATYRGRNVGTIGDIGIFSLTVGKGLSIYEGGFLACEDPTLRNVLSELLPELLSPHSEDERHKMIELVGLWALYNPIGLALVYGRDLRHWLKSNDPQRAVGDVFEDEIELHTVSDFRRRVGANAFGRLRQFLDSNVRRGIERAARLNALGQLKVLGADSENRNTWPFFFVLCEDQNTTKSILDRLWTKGLGVTKLFYRALADDPHLRSLVGSVSTPNARDFAARAFTITNTSMMTDADFDKVCRTIGGALN